MSAVRYRLAEAGDVEAIVCLLADDKLGAARERLGPPLPEGYRRAFAAMTLERGNEILVGERDGLVVACLQLVVTHGLSRQGQVRATLEAVRVASALRGQGIGKEIVAFAIERARAAGASIVQLTSDKSRVDAHRFYEQLGFKASHVGMKLELTS
ncbi:MAG: GNAT family N-acetyltransferase [Alphaproteobacteria bacterium]|nr:GNAT family N-acetyltransferase [Alphaproteobacteria bacterium]